MHSNIITAFSSSPFSALINLPSKINASWATAENTDNDSPAAADDEGNSNNNNNDNNNNNKSNCPEGQHYDKKGTTLFLKSSFL
jgi:hypothetical protein